MWEQSKVRAQALQRLLMNITLSRSLPLYIVNEYPKSGGSWVGQLLAELLDVPFPRNRAPSLRPSIMHCHYPKLPGMSNVVIVFRDGRDVMVSAYYHFLIPSEKNSPILVEKTRRDLVFSDYNDVNGNMPAFIEYMFDRYSRHWSPFRFTWADFVDEWTGEEVVFVRYEDLLADTAGTIGRVVRELTGRSFSDERLDEVAKKYSFAQQTSRKPGHEDVGSFLRKGIAGDWKSKFSSVARQAFAERASSQLIKLGYEANVDWVSAGD